MLSLRFPGCSDETVNAMAMDHARKHDPERKRTIGEPLDDIHLTCLPTVMIVAVQENLKCPMSLL